MLSLDILYYALVGFFFTHELDAVKRHEWRILPLIRALPEKLGERLFIWLHVPVFALLLLGGDGEDVNAVRVGLSVSAMVHIGLHWLNRKHPANEFDDAAAWALIMGVGVTGAAYLVAAGMS